MGASQGDKEFLQQLAVCVEEEGEKNDFFQRKKLAEEIRNTATGTRALIIAHLLRSYPNLRQIIQCATDEGNYEAALMMIKMQGGVFGAVSNSNYFINAINS